jgi:hypothetical protein
MTQITGASQNEVNEALALIKAGICTVCKLEDADPSTVNGQFCLPCFNVPKIVWH